MNSYEKTDTIKNLPPFRHCYWVIPGKFMAGGYPGGRSPDRAADNLKRLLASGIRIVINLMKPEELCCCRNMSGRYEDQLDEVANSRGISVDVIHMPIKDTWIPSRLEMCHILDTIDQAVENAKPVYLHCWGGRGRTGTVVGCYLARHGIAEGREIFSMIRKLRNDTDDRDLPSPETFRQVELVGSWARWE